jgi:glutamate carboxypeptidase
MKIAFLFLTLPLLVMGQDKMLAQKISKQEKQLLSIIEKNYEESVKFLENTVNINSGTHNIEGVKKVGMIYKAELEKLGFATRWIDMPSDMKRAGHLYAEIKGNTGKRLLLIGHLDTVFEPDSPVQTWIRKDTIASGPGTNDMKGGNMIIIYALKALKEAGLLKDRQVIVIMHGDEESSGKPVSMSRKDIIEAAQRSDIALCFETGTGVDYATVARRGSSSWTLTVTGKQAHSGGIFNKNTGAGAIYESARILDRFYTELREQYLTYSPGIILGGTQAAIDSSGTEGTVSGKTNVVPNTTIVKGDLRFISEEQKNDAREKMKAIVKENLPETKAEITFADGLPAMSPTLGNLNTLKLFSQASEDLGLGEVKPYDPGLRGAGDISFVAQYLDCLDGLGAMGGGAHAPSEFINLKTLPSVEKRTAVFIHRITTPQKIENKRKQ